MIPGTDAVPVTKSVEWLPSKAIRHGSPSRLPTRSRSSSSVQSTGASSVTTDQLRAADGRLCGDPSRFIAHGKLIQKTQKRAHRVCAVCGKHAHRLCTLCKDDKHKDGVPLHKPPATLARRKDAFPPMPQHTLLWSCKV